MTAPIDTRTRAALAAAWGLGPDAAFSALGTGLINRTLLVRDACGERVLQCLNTEIFRDPALVMRNCRAVISHLGRARAAGRYPYAVLELVPTLAGDAALVSETGEWWRMYRYLPGTRTHDTAAQPAMAYEAGRGFGYFAAGLADIVADTVQPVIAGFHDPARRYAAFRQAQATDRVGRVAGCAAECDAAGAYAEIVAGWERLLADGLPQRIVHNDCKLNNILFDTEGRALCVIDLDTVMPGSVLFDFGDLARTLVSPVSEDSTELDRVSVRHNFFAALARGYVEGCAMMTPLERANLVLGARLITGIMALRFLTDYLDGDRYYRVTHPDQNRDRARNQLALFAALGAEADELQGLINDLE